MLVWKPAFRAGKSGELNCSLPRYFVFSHNPVGNQWRIQGRGPSSPLFLDQTEARRAEKFFGGTGPSPYLKDWIQALGNFKRQNK